MSEPQSYANHVRRSPVFLFLMVLLLLNLVFAVYATIHAWPAFRHTHVWWVVMSVVFLVLVSNTRTSVLRVQDRVIRLEERLRMATLLPSEELPLLQSLTIQQIVALRFAADAELPALALRVAAEGLTPRQIKQSIVSWRPDTLRV